MMHPFVPSGCERIRRQLNVDERFWSWTYAFDDLYTLMDDPKTHQPIVLKPREDFFARHPSQFHPHTVVLIVIWFRIATLLRTETGR